MFCSRSLYSRISRLHERALRIAYNDYVSNFEEHLASDNSVNIHKRNLQVSATEMYKVLPTLSPSLIRELFTNKKSELQIKRDIDSDCEEHCTNKANFKIITGNYPLLSGKNQQDWSSQLELFTREYRKSLDTFKQEMKKNLNLMNFLAKCVKNMSRISEI